MRHRLHLPNWPGWLWDALIAALALALLLRAGALTLPARPQAELAGQHITVTPDGTFATLTSAGISYYARGSAAGDPRFTLASRSQILAIGFSRDGRFVAAGESDGALTVWSVADRRRVLQMTAVPRGGQLSHFWSIALSPDGRYVAWSATYALSKAVNGIRYVSTDRIWDRDTQSSRVVREVSYPVVDFIPRDIRFSPDGQLLVLVSGELEVRRLADNSLVYRIDGGSGRSRNFESVDVSPDQRWLAIGGSGEVTLCRFADGRVAQIVQVPLRSGRGLPVTALAFSADSRTLAVTGRYNTSGGRLDMWPPFFSSSAEPIHILDVPSGQPLVQLRGEPGGATRLQATPDVGFISWGSEGDRLWRIEPRAPWEPLAWGIAGCLAMAGLLARRWRRRAWQTPEA